MRTPIRIPTAFQLYGQTIKVNRVVDLMHRQASVGECRFRDEVINLQKNTKDNPHTEAEMEQAFLHELTHMILHFMANKLVDDEEFVDAFAHLLHQALTTGEYKREGK
jgi:predicted SprT family Zn-dependent metalloprotease